MRNSKILVANLKVLQPNISASKKNKTLALPLIILTIAIFLALGLGLTSTKQVIGVYSCRSYTSAETAVAEVRSSGHTSKAITIDKVLIPGTYLVVIHQSPIEKALGMNRIDFQEPSEEFENLVKEIFREERASGSSFIPFKKPA